MKVIAILFVLIANTALAQSVDKFGREIACSGTGPFVCSVSGISVTAISKDSAIRTINSMAPDGWAPPPPQPPDELPLWQLQAYLATQGKLVAANAIAAASPPPVPQWWAAGGALTINRTAPGTITFAAQLGLTTQAQIDAVFLAASAITLP